MRTLLSVLFPVFMLIALAGCNSDTGSTSDQTINDSTGNAGNTGENALEREPVDDEIRAYGIIQKAEDQGYPMYGVTVEFPEKQTREDFNINLEAIGIAPDSLHAMEGKYATIYYTSEMEEMLMDIHLDGASLLGAYAPPNNPEWTEITGVLKGADEVTPGDLPGKVSITDKSGKTMHFDYFIDEATVGANGKEVTAYYDMRVMNNITYMHVAEE